MTNMRYELLMQAICLNFATCFVSSSFSEWQSEQEILRMGVVKAQFVHPSHSLPIRCWQTLSVVDTLSIISYFLSNFALQSLQPSPKCAGFNALFPLMDNKVLLTHRQVPSNLLDVDRGGKSLHNGQLDDLCVVIWISVQLGSLSQPFLSRLSQSTEMR